MQVQAALDGGESLGVLDDGSVGLLANAVR